MLGIVTGLKSEARLLRGLDVACISIGGKAAGAAEKIERLVARGVTGLVSFGIAGALDPGLKCGDVVVAGVIIGPDGARWPCAPDWVAALRAISSHSSLPGLTRQSKSEATAVTGKLGSPGLDAARRPGDDEHEGCGGGAVLGLDALLASPQEKAEAFARTGALAIDMESHHVARAAAAHGLPFIAIRAISDRADEALPACFADFVDGAGATIMSAVFAALISGRVSVGELLAAGRSSRRAHRALFGRRGAVAGLR